MSKSETAIVLKAGGRGMECISTVCLTPEAEKVVRRPKSGQPKAPWARQGHLLPWGTLHCPGAPQGGHAAGRR